MPIEGIGGGGSLRADGGALPEIPGYRWDGYASRHGRITISAPALAEEGLQVSVHWAKTPFDKRSRERFQREAERLFVLQDDIASPHLMPFFGPAVATDGTPVLITGRYGKPVTEDLRPGGVRLVLVRAVALAFASVLDRLHAKDVLHRAVGPDAVLVGQNGQVRIAVPLLPVLAELALADDTGTGHEAPEVLRGNDPTPASEIYSLAATLWTLLSGQRQDTHVRLAEHEPPPLVRDDLPEAAVATLLAGLSRDPAARPPTALALVSGFVELEGAQGSATTTPVRSAEPVGGGYVAEHELGIGASGTVFRVRRRSDGALFAAKRKHTSLLHDDDAVDRMVGEWHAVRRLPPHPHLVHIHEVILSGEVTVVMDLVDGPNLNVLLRNRAVGRGEGLRFLAEVASALAIVHDRGVVHRDVKPANVLVHIENSSRHAKLTDFGIAKLLNRAVTQQGVMMGTWPYLAPEAVDATAARAPADIYALGVMAYEVIAGYRPFREKDLPRLLEQHKREAPARPAGVPDEVWDFVARCLWKSPDGRPSAAEAATAFADLSRVVARAMPDLPDAGAPEQDQAPTGDFGEPDGQEFARQLEKSVRGWPTGGVEGTDPPPIMYDMPDQVPEEIANPPTQPPRHAPPSVEGEAAAEGTKRRRKIVIALVCAAVLGLGGGLFWSLRSTPPESRDEPTSNLRYVLPVTARADAQGTVTLTWPDNAEGLPGFNSYLVRHGANGEDVTEVTAGQTTLTLPVSSPGECYQVIALGVTAEPPAAPAPTCLSTTGSTTTTQ